MPEKPGCNMYKIRLTEAYESLLIDSLGCCFAIVYHKKIGVCWNVCAANHSTDDAQSSYTCAVSRQIVEHEPPLRDPSPRSPLVNAVNRPTTMGQNENEVLQ